MYAGQNIPNSQDFPKMLGQNLNRDPQWIDSAVKFAMQKATTQTSIRDLLDLLVRMRLFTWEQIESLVHRQAVLTLEQVLPHAGQYNFSPTAQFDLCYGEACTGLNWSKLMEDVASRQEEWSALAPLIPSMEAVPHLQANALEKITDSAVRKQLQEWVDGKRSLVDIAEGLNKDPIQVSQSYLPWVQAGWVGFEGSKPAEKNDLPTILAVDDSLVIQTMIKRALVDRYQVFVASNATDALSLINNKKVALLLLDVTMPDIDGLELCRTLRSMPQFRTLPIVMLTARDGLVDKLKGQIAGSTQYLTKPFDAEKLRDVVAKHVSAGTTSNTVSTSNRLSLSK
jgi:twitching motility two-component system response regulator PilG